MEEHRHLEGLKMVDGIDNPVITFELRSLKVSRKWLLHDPRIKRWVIIEPVGRYRGSIVDCIDPLINFLKPSLERGVSDDIVLGVLEGSSIRG